MGENSVWLHQPLVSETWTKPVPSASTQPQGDPKKYDSSSTVFILTGKIIPSISRSKMLCGIHIQATGYLTSEGRISLGHILSPFNKL